MALSVGGISGLILIERSLNLCVASRDLERPNGGLDSGLLDVGKIFVSLFSGGCDTGAEVPAACPRPESGDLPDS